MSALEQVVGFPLQIFEEAESEVDEVIERSLLIGLPDAAIEYGLRLIASGHLGGLKLCKLLYELTEMWDKFHTDDDIKDAVFKGMGVPPETYRKYESLWRGIFANEKIPVEYRNAMKNKPISGLIAITAAARDGEFNEEHWERLVTAHDKSSMLSIRDDVRGVNVSENRRLQLTWERDGRLVARRGEEGPEEVGFLPHRTGISLVDDAVRRIVDAVGITER